MKEKAFHPSRKETVVPRIIFKMSMANAENQRRVDHKNGNFLFKNIVYEGGGKFPISNTSDHSRLTNFLKIFFDFAYYLCISPFRFKENSVSSNEDFIGNKRESYSIYEWRPQQCICALMHALCMLRIITEARWNTPERLDEYGKNPEQYFLLVMNIFNVFYKGIFMNQVWRHKDRILLVINFAGSESTLPSDNPNFIRRSSVIRLALTLNVGITLVSAIAGKFFLANGFLRWSPSWWYRRIVASTRYTFFYGRRMQLSLAPEMSEVGIVDQVLAVFNFMSMMSRYLLGYYTDLFILVMGLTLWSSSCSFAKSFDHTDGLGDNDEERFGEVVEHGRWASAAMKSGSASKFPYDTNEWSRIYGRFKALRILSHLINQAIGSIVCWFLGNAILAYSLNLDTIFVSEDVHKRLGLFFNYCCAFGVLFVSADICKQMESVKLWLSIDRNRKQVPGDQLNIVLHEMTVNDIGIRGGDIFTITYPILATFIGTILTYFIICVQQNTPQVN